MIKKIMVGNIEVKFEYIIIILLTFMYIQSNLE